MVSVLSRLQQVCRIDIGADDQSFRKIFCESDTFLTCRAPEGQDLFCARRAGSRRRENLRIPVERGSGSGADDSLEAAGRPTSPTRRALCRARSPSNLDFINPAGIAFLFFSIVTALRRPERTALMPQASCCSLGPVAHPTRPNFTMLQTMVRFQASSPFCIAYGGSVAVHVSAGRAESPAQNSLPLQQSFAGRVHQRLRSTFRKSLPALLPGIHQISAKTAFDRYPQIFAGAAAMVPDATAHPVLRLFDRRGMCHVEDVLSPRPRS